MSHNSIFSVPCTNKKIWNCVSKKNDSTVREGPYPIPIEWNEILDMRGALNMLNIFWQSKRIRCIKFMLNSNSNKKLKEKKFWLRHSSKISKTNFSLLWVKNVLLHYLYKNETCRKVKIHLMKFIRTGGVCAPWL